MERFFLRLFPSLGKRVALAVTFASLVAWGVFVFFASQTGQEILDKEAHIKASGIARMVTGMVEHVGIHGDERDIEDVLRLAMATSDIIEAYVVAEDGSILWRARPSDSLVARPFDNFRALKDRHGEQYVTFRDRDSVFAYIVEPFRIVKTDTAGNPGRSTRNGFFAMKISIEDVRSTAIDHRKVNVIFSIAIFLALGLLIYFLLSLLVLRPISALRERIGTVESTVLQIQPGERASLPALPVPGRNDEIDELYRGLNRLIDRINAANARLTELHQAQLEHADRLAATGEMAAGMAHEIKNPIAGVLGALQVFHGEIEDGEPRKEIIAEMMNQLERVTHAVNDLLQYARPTPPHFEVIDLHPLIERTAAILTRQFKATGVEVIRRFAGEEIRLDADRKQLQQAFWNLLLNALQATDAGGSVTVSTSADRETVTVEITDTGRGMSEDELAKIFKPFFTTKHKGTGLGMTITRRIIEQHAGSLGVASIKGRGTTVLIRVPRAHREGQ